MGLDQDLTNKETEAAEVAQTDQSTNTAVKSETIALCLSEGIVAIGASLIHQQKEALA